MKRLTARDHLIVARDHGLNDVPPLYAIEDLPNRFLIHLDCDNARTTTPVAFEDLPDSFLLGGCSQCVLAANFEQHDRLVDNVDRLISVAAVALDLTGLAHHLLDGSTLRPLEFETPEDEEDVLSQYAATGYFLRRTESNGHLSWAELDALKDLDAPNGVRAHVVDLAESLALQWRRISAHAPIRTHLAGNTPGQPRIRVVPNRSRQRGFDNTRQNPHDAALQLEATTLLSTLNWDLIEWDTTLAEWATTEQLHREPAHAIAEAEGLNQLQLEQVLRLYTRETWNDGPSLQELVDAIRLAHA